MSAYSRGTAALAAVPFFLICGCLRLHALSLFESPFPPHPLNSLLPLAGGQTAVETELTLTEWARNLDSPGQLLFEDRLIGLKAEIPVYPNLVMEASCTDAYKIRQYSRSLTVEEGVPFRLDMAHSVNETGFSLGAVYHRKDDRFLAVSVRELSNPQDRQLGATIQGLIRVRFMRPFASFRSDFPDLNTGYTIHTQIATNPFEYRTLFSRKAWLLGSAFYCPLQERPVVATHYVQSMEPFSVYPALDSLVFRSTAFADILELPLDFGRLSNTLQMGFLRYDGLLGVYYLNVSGMGYSTVTSNMPVKGSGFGAEIRSQWDISGSVGMRAEAGYGSIGVDPIREQKLNPAKYEVISQGNYVFNSSGSLSGWFSELAVNWKFLKSHFLDQSVGFLRLYPDYNLDWVNVGFFTGTTSGSASSDVIFTDMIYYRGAWKYRKGRFETNLSFDQGIPVQTRYLGKGNVPSGNAGAGGRKDLIIGLERLAISLKYFPKSFAGK
jgi:hypothetical protein